MILIFIGVILAIATMISLVIISRRIYILTYYLKGKGDKAVDRKIKTLEITNWAILAFWFSLFIISFIAEILGIPLLTIFNEQYSIWGK